MRSNIPVKNGAVHVRGIAFPLPVIQQAMLETGGILVADENVCTELDFAITAYKAKTRTNKLPDSLIIDAFPGYRFVPKQITIHKGVPGVPGFDVEGKPSEKNLYFAVRRMY